MAKLAFVGIRLTYQRKFPELSRLNPADLALAQHFDEFVWRTNVPYVEPSAAGRVAGDELSDLRRCESSCRMRAKHGALCRFSIGRKARRGIHSNYSLGTQRSGIARYLVDIFNHGRNKTFHPAFQAGTEKGIHNGVG